MRQSGRTRCCRRKSLRRWARPTIWCGNIVIEACRRGSGGFFNLNVNYYATGSSTPHVPETCWAGAGRVESTDSRVIFDVDGVKRRDGSLVSLRVRLVSFLPDRGDAAQVAALSGTATGPIYSNVAYVFQVNGDYVTNARDVMSHFWKASNRYAYHAKIEVTPMMHMGSEFGQEGEPRWWALKRRRSRWFPIFLDPRSQRSSNVFPIRRS